MCAGAIVMARVGRLVFGAYDPQYGCAGSVYRIPEDPAFSALLPLGRRTFARGMRGAFAKKALN